MARRGRFRLETVLEHRRRVERERQGEVAQLERARVAIEERIRALQAGAGDGRGALRGMLGPGPVALGAVRMQANAGMHTALLVQRAGLELAGVHRRLERAREQLLAAAVARKAVEALRARWLAAREAAARRRENAALDELGVLGSARARREGA